MANYQFYLAESKTLFTEGTLTKKGFHLRIAVHSNASEKPFLEWNTSRPIFHIVTTSLTGGHKLHNITIWLRQTDSASTSIIHRDFAFSETNVPDLTKIKGTITAHILKNDGSSTTIELQNIKRDNIIDAKTGNNSGSTGTDDDLVYPDMPAEYPIGNTR